MPIGNTSAARNLEMSHDIRRNVLAVKGALSSVQDLSRSVNRTLEAGGAYQSARDELFGVSRMGVLDERSGLMGAASAASASARMTSALAAAERASLLMSSVDRRTAASRIGAFGGPLSGEVGGIAGHTRAYESSALAGLSRSTRDAFNGPGAIAKHVEAFGGASPAYQQVQKQLEAGGLLTAARRAMDAAGTAGLSHPATSAAEIYGARANLSAIQVGAVRDFTGLEERLRHSTHASRLSAGMHAYGRDPETFGVAGALNAAAIAGLSPALQAAAAFDQSYAARWSAGIASDRRLIERAGLSSAAYALVSRDLPSPFKGALGIGSITDAYPYLGLSGSVREAMEKARLGTRFAYILSGPPMASMFGDSALMNAVKAMRDIAPQVVEIPEEVRRRWEVAEAFMARWEGSALEYLLSPLSVVHLYRFSTLEEGAVEEALLAALERIVTEEDFASELVSALDSVTHLTGEQRGDLQAGLGHAAQGNFERALPPMMLGMEGALWSTGQANELIDADRRITSGLKKGRKADSIEIVIKALPFEDGFSTFAVHRVFGGVGNPVRHGVATGTRREHVLYLIVLMAGWLTDSMGLPAREVLGQHLRDSLLS
jgi:hypothetical protein